MKQIAYKSSAENYRDSVMEFRTMSNSEFKQAQTDIKRNEGAYHSWYLRAFATVAHEKLVGHTLVTF